MQFLYLNGLQLEYKLFAIRIYQGCKETAIKGEQFARVYSTYVSERANVLFLRRLLVLSFTVLFVHVVKCLFGSSLNFVISTPPVVACYTNVSVYILEQRVRLSPLFLVAFRRLQLIQLPTFPVFLFCVRTEALPVDTT